MFCFNDKKHTKDELRKRKSEFCKGMLYGTMKCTSAVRITD